MRLAIHAPTLGLSLPDQPFGKDVANQGLFSALARYGNFDGLDFLSAENPPTQSLQKHYGSNHTGCTISRSALTDTRPAVQAGTLLRGQPYLAELAWARGHRHGHQAYSLVGVIHTLAPPKVRELIGEVLIAPVQPWDALICTSPSVQAVLNTLLNRWQEHLLRRFGGTSCVRPQLPVLPLGVDQANLLEQRSDQRARQFLRKRLNLAEEDCLVLWIGRLSFFEKAYPQAMFIALQKAAQRCNRRVQFVMAGWFPNGEVDHQRYREAADRYAPSVPVHFLDGRNPEVVRCCWAAADLFLSLVDNPQETFGLAPVEAMAAGVPVVVSDWDGYQFTVSDGVEGFRIPTLAPSEARQGELLALDHDFGLLSYQDYVGAVAQHVAVDTESAAAAIARLADDAALRQRMGQAGVQAVRDRFDWRVIARLHRDLYGALAEKRQAADAVAGPATLHPLRSDPFHDFAGFATSTLLPQTQLRLALPWPQLIEQVNQLAGLDRCYEQIHARAPELGPLLERLQALQPCSCSTLLAAFPPERHDALRLTITWFAKLGCIQWSAPVAAP
jgi:D-inositol-3-phosphate glycosyltransferase